MSDLDEFDELSRFLSEAQRRADSLKMRARYKEARQQNLSVSEDYAERLAEKAVFRRLLSDEALDGVRFRWLLARNRVLLGTHDCDTLDQIRKWIDSEISENENRGSPG
jgi:hypothetical protein